MRKKSGNEDTRYSFTPQGKSVLKYDEQRLIVANRSPQMGTSYRVRILNKTRDIVIGIGVFIHNKTGGNQIIKDKCFRIKSQIFVNCRLASN